jgi:MoaA/NifB/PqqE/SkfB family radical SAM enzyme
MAVSLQTSDLQFLWLELTGRCQLRCVHCYSESGPDASPGTMTPADWRRVIDDAASLGARGVTLIGGEPTLHPELPALVRYALDHGLGVEVYSNLARPISDVLWTAFALPGVRLATSYYGADTQTHEMVTLGPAGSHRLTRANIVEALRRGIPVRGSVVQVSEAQDVETAVEDLRTLGVATVDVDRLRQVGRGVRDLEPNVDQLCGRCATGRLAISASGDVWPCVFSRWLTLGNVRDVPLSVIADSATTAHVRSRLEQAFTTRSGDEVQDCTPDCSPFTKSCSPDTNCTPNDKK